MKSMQDFVIVSHVKFTTATMYFCRIEGHTVVWTFDPDQARVLSGEMMATVWVNTVRECVPYKQVELREIAAKM